ncbi:MAG: tetratricopeptide repeat protein, partial [Polyangiaceae bacterium]
RSKTGNTVDTGHQSQSARRKIITTGHRGTMSKKGKSKKSTTRRSGAPPSVRSSRPPKTENPAKAARMPAFAADASEPAPASEDPARSLPAVLTVPPLKVTTPMKVLTPIEFTRDVDPSGAPPVAEHEHEHGFFADDARPAFSRQDHADHDHADIEDHRPSKMTPVAKARRALFTKYVKGTVALLTALCLVAVLRAATDRHDDTPVAHAQTPTIVAANVQAAPAPTQLDLARVPAPLSASAAADKIAADEEKVAKAAADSGTKVEEAKVEEAKPGDLPKADAPKVEEAKAEAPKSDKTAGQEKAAARRALESGHAGVAIEAGERSVALDPTDGEAWLLLGAAYQEKGKAGDARRCFNACLKQGKKGPIGECRQMLQ